MRKIIIIDMLKVVKNEFFWKTSNGFLKELKTT